MFDELTVIVERIARDMESDDDQYDELVAAIRELCAALDLDADDYLALLPDPDGE